VRILVTGGAGRVGKTIVSRLVQQGYAVHVLDSKPQVEIAGATYAQCDIMDYDSLYEQMRGCDKVVHLAAIPSPIPVPGHELFRIDVGGTFNVFEAAAAAGIKRIAQASSINALGCMWGTGEMDIRYFPIDEQHPTYTTDPYSFSKRMVEDIGEYYWRRDGISSVSFRLPGVWLNDDINSAARQEQLAQGRKALAEYAALPLSERLTRLAAAKQSGLEFRAQRMMEYPKAATEGRKFWESDDWLWRAYINDRYNFWTYINELDSAQAFDKALFADYEGSHALFVNAKNNFLNYDTNTLLDLFFADVTERKQPIGGTVSPISNEKARRLIGYEPEYAV
jgi:NAD(P)-dependent dehydrogenase (short-subunit alcohol dehydrogenase family)